MHQGPAAGSGSRLHRGGGQPQQDGDHGKALRGDPGAHHELRAFALAAVEAVEAVQEGGRGAQAADGHQRVLARFAHELVLDAFHRLEDGGAEAFNISSQDELLGPNVLTGR